MDRELAELVLEEQYLLEEERQLEEELSTVEQELNNADQDSNQHSKASLRKRTISRATLRRSANNNNSRISASGAAVAQNHVNQHQAQQSAHSPSSNHDNQDTCPEYSSGSHSQEPTDLPSSVSSFESVVAELAKMKAENDQVCCVYQTRAIRDREVVHNQSTSKTNGTTLLSPLALTCLCAVEGTTCCSTSPNTRSPRGN